MSSVVSRTTPSRYSKFSVIDLRRPDLVPHPGRGGLLVIQLDQPARRGGILLGRRSAWASAWVTTGCTPIAASRPTKLFEYFLAICGTLTLEGGPIFWVATHRLHHQHSDQPRGSAYAPRQRVLGAHGLDYLRRGASQRHGADVALRARSGEGPVLPLVDDLSLGAADGARLHAARRSADGALVNWAIFLRVVAGPARDLAGQLGDPPVGPPPLRHARTIRGTPGGSRSSRSAKAGTTTTTPTRPRPATAWPGTSSTRPGSS